MQNRPTNGYTPHVRGTTHNNNKERKQKNYKRTVREEQEKENYDGNVGEGE